MCRDYIFLIISKYLLKVLQGWILEMQMKEFKSKFSLLMYQIKKKAGK